LAIVLVTSWNPNLRESRRPTMGWENAGIYDAKVDFGSEWKDDSVQAALPTTLPKNTEEIRSLE
jgi:hypothetical protein